MIFNALPLAGAYEVTIATHPDERGFFARTWCAEAARQHGLLTHFAQSSISHNHHCGTLRGLHYQVEPAAETKLVCCIDGKAYDVLVDLRPNSTTFLHWCSVELNAHQHNAVYIPPGIAHGFQTLTANTRLFYQISTAYSAEHGRGVRWNDPAFGIIWPLAVSQINSRDANYPNFQP